MTLLMLITSVTVPTPKGVFKYNLTSRKRGGGEGGEGRAGCCMKSVRKKKGGGGSCPLHFYTFFGKNLQLNLNQF